MANNPKKSLAVKTAQLAAYATEAGTNAVIDLYDGAQPASPDAVVGSVNLLSSSVVTGSLSVTNTGGVLTFNPIGDTVGSAACTLAGKTATWARLRSSAGVGVLDFTVGATGSDMNMTPDALIKTGQTLSIPSYTITSGN